MQPIEIKHVLAAVDFSDWTSPVLRTASEVAARHGARLTAVYAETFLPPPYFTERGMDRIQEVLKSQKDEARRYLTETVRREVGERVPAETRLLETPPAEGILTAADETGADLIVLGTHGRSGWNRLLLGSVSEKILRGTRVPVLTVRGSGKEAASCRMPPRRVLCPVNFTDVARESLRYAADLTRRFGAELIVVSSLEGEASGSDEALRAHEQKLCAWVPEAAQVHCTLKPVVRRGDAAEQVLQTARQEDADLIVIGAQHRPLLETTVFGTTSVRVVRHATCPVLTVVRR